MLPFLYLAEAERVERSPAGLESAMLPVTPSFYFGRGTQSRTGIVGLEDRYFLR